MEHANNPTAFSLGNKPLNPSSTLYASGDDGFDKADMFLKEQGASLHPIFGMEDPYSRQRSPLAQSTFNQSTLLHTEQFLEVMEVYQASIKDSKIKNLDLRGKHSWDEVLRVAKDAEAAYKEVKPLRKAGRWATDYAVAFLPYVRLIPNDFFMSILSGGLRLVLEAAASIGERRDKVLKTLLWIPRVITEAEYCRENFPTDMVLYERAEDVYVAALTAIEGTTRWLMQKSVLKPVRALLLGPLYTQSFKEKVQGLDEALGALKARVDQLRDGSITRIEKTAEHTKTIVISTDKSVTEMTADLKTLHKSYDETKTKIDDIHDLQQAKEEANAAMKLVLQETNKTAKWMQKNDRVIRRLRWQISVLEMAAVPLNQHDLLEVLNVSAELPEYNLQRILRASQSTELPMLASAQVIVRGEKFQEWKQTDSSASLFVEGGPASSSFKRNGPLSVMSSRLIDSLRDMEPAVAIHFFCGLHTGSSDPVRGPQGMMRSLISQVLRRFSVDLDFISSRRYREQLEAHNLRTLCDCFGKIVKRLPIDTVLFCIIDSVCFFEKKEWAEDCQKATNDLQDLADDDEFGAVFKLLITSPSRSRYVGNMMPDQCRISLSKDNSAARNGPTERDLMGAQRRIRSQDNAVYETNMAGVDGGRSDESFDSCNESDF